MRNVLILILLVTSSSTTLGAVVDEVRQGQWLEVRGRYQANDEFIAEKITLVVPDDEAAMIGTVRKNDRGQLTLLGHRLKIEDDATFHGVDRNHLADTHVKIEGDLAATWVFSVEEVKSRGQGRDRIEGPVDELTRSKGSIRMQILGYRIRFNETTEFVGFGENRFPVLSKATAPKLFQSQISIDQADDDDRFGSGFKLSDDLRLTSRVVGEAAWEDNYNFNDADNEDRQDLEASVRTRLEWDPQTAWNGVFELRYSSRHRERQDRRNQDDSNLQIGEAFLSRQVNDVTRITVGRQDFDDNREWLYDANLDAIRFTSEWSGIEFDASVSKIFSADGSREEEANNFIFTVARGLFDGSIGAYYIKRDFAVEHDEDSYHYGIRAYGEWLQSEQLWLDVARQGGKRGRSEIDAYAADVGGTWQMGRTNTWYVTTGVAFASGDDPATGDDEQFRQTGLQDNSGKLGGLTSFRYYGELSDPELSNLWISTVGIGKRVSPQLSIDVVAHSYRLDERASALAEVEWDGGLSGTSSDLGWESDVIIGFRGREFWDIEAVFGYFAPGEAFIDDKSAWFGKFQLKFRH